MILHIYRPLGREIMKGGDCEMGLSANFIDST